MPRAVKPWTGKTDDAMPPPRVRQRVFDRAGGVCHLCKLPIRVPGETWQLDHVKALIEGGENTEANCAPAHSHCHLVKTNGEKARKAKDARVHQKHIGAVRPKQSIQSRGFDKREKPEKLPRPGPRPIYISQERIDQ